MIQVTSLSLCLDFKVASQPFSKSQPLICNLSSPIPFPFCHERYPNGRSTQLHLVCQWLMRAHFLQALFPYPDVCSQLQLLVGPALRRSKPLGHTQPPSLHRPLSDSFRTLPLFSVLHTTASFYFSLGHSWARGLYSPARPPSSLSSLAWHCSPSVRPGTPVPHPPNSHNSTVSPTGLMGTSVR